jgi:2',3'-cyclic-nucleotide 2'-phosphodiesterase (5'-nucleotidase family)
LSGFLTKYTVANAGCKAIYEKYKKNHSDLALAMENSQRASLSSGTISYSSLYKATPFMNKIVIMKVLGQDITNEAAYNKTYTGDTTTYGTLNASTYYTVAVIDYLVYHQNIIRATTTSRVWSTPTSSPNITRTPWISLSTISLP